VAARQSRDLDRGMAIVAVSNHGQDARATPHVGPNAVRPCGSCQGAVAKWKGICLQSRQPRFDSEPRLHSGQHWCAGGPYKPVIAPDEGARQSSIL
jgi:hypothetical protein